MLAEEMGTVRSGVLKLLSGLLAFGALGLSSNVFAQPDLTVQGAQDFLTAKLIDAYTDSPTGFYLRGEVTQVQFTGCKMGVNIHSPAVGVTDKQLLIDFSQTTLSDLPTGIWLLHGAVAFDTHPLKPLGPINMSFDVHDTQLAARVQHAFHFIESKCQANTGF